MEYARRSSVRAALAGLISSAPSLFLVQDVSALKSRSSRLSLLRSECRLSLVPSVPVKPGPSTHPRTRAPTIQRTRTPELVPHPG